MKKLSKLYLLIIFATGLLFSCSSPTEDDALLKSVMKNFMSTTHPKYTETQIDQTVKFEATDKSFVLEGTIKEVEDFRVITLYANSIETQTYLTAVFAKIELVDATGQKVNPWGSIFENEVEFGKLDTILDLNNDNVPEIILQKYERNKIGYESKLVIYAKKEAQKYLSIGEIAPNYYRGSENKKAISTARLLKVDDYKKLYVNTLETDSISNNKDNQKRSSSFYLVTTLGQLNQEFADQLILNSEPLAFKVSLDNFWGINYQVGNEDLSKPVKLMDGFADILTTYSETKQILPSEYTEIMPASEGLIPVKNKDGLWGFVNFKGEFAVECKYIGVSKFEKGKAVFQVKDEEDWTKAYRYIDDKGKELGLFFDKLVGKDCIEANVIESYTSSTNLKYCPNGILNRQTNGETWGGSDAFYPNVGLVEILAKYANMKSDYSKVIKKVDAIDNQMEYSEDGYNFSINIERFDNNNMKKVKCAKESNMNGGSIEFEVDGTGIRVKEFYGE